MTASAGARAGATGIVLLTLATGQFVMALDTTVMNTAIATVADDLGTTVTGIQTAITLYTLVMASLMITGGKLGEILGRKRAFAIGCVVYACGSLTTALAPNLTVLIIGWSFLEGLGAVLIMPAIVALVASNFAQPERPRAYGLVAAAGAIAAALGPVIGGAFTTYASWRWVFAGEVLIVVVILVLARRVADTPAEKGVRLDLVGTALSAVGLGLIVLGVLRSGTWGFVQPKPEAPEWLGLSPVVWLVLAGGVVLALFLWWENRRLRRGEGALIDPTLLRNVQLRSGVTSFLFMFLILAGIFFVVPLFLSVSLGLSAVETGVRLLPLSLTLLLFAVGVPKLFPNASPRRVINLGFTALFAGLVLLVALLEAGAGPEIVTWPLLLAGSGLGRDGVSARKRDRLRAPRREERRGGRAAEHRHPARRLHRHRPGGRGARLRAHGLVLHRHPGQPGRPRQRRVAGGDGAGRRRPVPLRCRPRGRAGRCGRAPGHGGRGGRDQRGEPHRRAPRGRVDPRPAQPHRPALHAGHPEGATRRAADPGSARRDGGAGARTRAPLRLSGDHCDPRARQFAFAQAPLAWPPALPPAGIRTAVRAWVSFTGSSPGPPPVCM